jgi:hypothetical protein
MSKEQYNKVWNKHFAQVRSLFELLISGIKDETTKKNVDNAKVLIEESMYRTRQELDETRKNN